MWRGEAYGRGGFPNGARAGKISSTATGATSLTAGPLEVGDFTLRGKAGRGPLGAREPLASASAGPQGLSALIS
ncbi:hypothetical protein E6O75_ATG01009 [Venturia nashicola]|uniref:Uncharacterized protein n=1 Tax=Venturia nashicola TaxID=86259 RepID=A0A4Z1PKI6_9PEZI|nr:hypothetical protein E6O75_ATG01009 [Venturia nashicola]